MNEYCFKTNLVSDSAQHKIENFLVSEVEFESLKFRLGKDSIILLPKNSNDVLMEKRGKQFFNFFSLTIKLTKECEHTNVSLITKTYKKIAMASFSLLAIFLIGMYPTYTFLSLLTFKIYLGIFTLIAVYFTYKLYQAILLQKKVESKLIELLSRYSPN